MKYLLSFILIILVSGGFAQSNTIKTDTTSINKIVYDSLAGEDILLGKCTMNGLKSFPEFLPFFEKEYNEYEPYTGFLKNMKDTLDKIKIIIVMATWCGDSKREVPRMYKILNSLEFPDSNITLICVDKNKKAGNLDMEDYYVELVPTFIFMKGNVELGRIIEIPNESLENDMAQILMSQ